MIKIEQLILAEKVQYRMLTALVFAVLAGAGMLRYSNRLVFQRFLGDVNPLAVFVLSGALSFVLLSFFLSKGWFAIYRKEYLKGLLQYSGAIVLYLTIAILVDWWIVYPEDMNIAFPQSLIFYPVIGFLVEILFHLIPLFVLLLLATSIFKRYPFEKVVWFAIAIVAMLEPTYQVLMDAYPVWAMVLVWLNLFLFNFTQLTIFKKYGFISMYLFRLLYYIVWHIVWGYFRLELLF